MAQFPKLLDRFAQHVRDVHHNLSGGVVETASTAGDRFKPGDSVRENREGAHRETVTHVRHPMVYTDKRGPNSPGGGYHHTKLVHCHSRAETAAVVKTLAYEQVTRCAPYTVNSAARALQKICGITDGGLASLHLDESSWDSASRVERVEMLIRWLTAEGVKVEPAKDPLTDESGVRWNNEFSRKWGPVVKKRMADAKAHPLVRGHKQRFWLLDTSPLATVYADKSEKNLRDAITDAISVVDVTALGNIAKGSPDWVTSSKGYALRQFGAEHAERDVLEGALDWLERQVRGY